jgi:DNA polymerase III subunit delta'
MFKDFPEQKAVIEILQRSLDRNRLAHGYLFNGNSQEELEAVARTLAKVLNCQSPPKRGENGIPIECCDKCDSCNRIDGFNHPDVLWVRPEMKSRVIGIDQVRDLIQTINLKPTIAEYKVGVIVCADRLRHEAANAFLKTLEEPPSKSILILLTTDVQRILETIISRCLRLNFAGEGAHFSPRHKEWVNTFSSVAAESGRGLLPRYRLLGLLLKELGAEKEEIEAALSERSPLEKYNDIDPDLREKYEKELVAAVEAEYRRQRNDLLAALQWWLRDVWLQTVSDASSASYLGFPDLMTAAQAIAKRISPSDARENLEILDSLQRQLSNTNVQEALALEVSLLKLKL